MSCSIRRVFNHFQHRAIPLSNWRLTIPCLPDNLSYGFDHELWLLDWDVVPALISGHEAGTGNGVQP